MRRLAIFSCAFAMATAAYVYLLTPISALICAVVIALAGTLFTKGDTAVRMRIISAAMALGFLWSWGYEQFYIAPLRELCGEDVHLTATVCDYPQETDYGCRVETEVNGGKILLYLNEDYALKPSDRIEVDAEVIDVSRGGESGSLYFQAKDISLLAFANEVPKIVRADCVSWNDIPKIWANEVCRHITELFPDDTEPFMRALMMGDDSDCDYALENQMQITGIVHIFSVSGMHVSLLVGFIMLLVRNKKLAAICAIVLMFLFAAMLGFVPSITRAVIMNSVMLLAPILKRENDPPTALGVALMVILIANPWAIASLSLQLSFLAMAGIILFAQPIHDRITMRFRKRNKLCKIISANISLSLSASALTVPLIASNFGIVSIIAPLSNVLLMNAFSFVFTSGFAILPIGLFVPLGRSLAWGLSWLIRLMLIVIEWLSEIPFAAIYTDSDYVVYAIGAIYVMIAVFLTWRKGRKLTHLCAAILAILLCAVGFCMLDTSESSFTLLDVGQGQSILVQSGNFTAAIDCGGDSGAEDGERLARRLLMMGRTRLDALILTHYDADHTGGLEQLARRVNIACIYMPQFDDDSGRHGEILALAQAENLPIRYVTQNITIETGDLRLQIFKPVSNSEDNDGLSALMSLGECDILVTGDMSTEAEYALLRSVDLPDLEVLIAGHHGSKYSTSERLLGQTKPELVLISVGKNSYGHPSREVLKRIEAIGAIVYRTDSNGDITITR